ncbi:hypothetical protein GCM10027294_25700 [Marinactinospora endophytica]
MIRDFGGPLYADLLREYRVDLRAVCRGEGPPPSLVLELIEHLTSDSAFAAAAAAESTGSDPREWRRWQSRVHTALLAAEQIDFTREQTKAHVGKRYRFKPHPRPGSTRKPRLLTVAEINRGREAP